MKWGPTIISIVALVFSAIALWVQFFSPFSGQAYVSSMMLKMEQIEGVPGEARVRTLIVVTQVQFANRGADLGQSESLQILLERKGDGKQWRFSPEVFINYGEFIRGLGQRGDRDAREQMIQTVVEGPFTPPFLQGRQSLEKAIVFAPPTGLPVSMEELKQGDYLILFNSVAQGKIKQLQTIPFRISRDELTVLQEGKGQVISITR